MTIVEVCAIIGCAANILGAVVPCIIVAIYNRQRYSAYCSRRIAFLKFNSLKVTVLWSHFLFILAVDTITVVSSYESERADFAISVSGDSMLPDYENGDVVLVESCEELPVGEVGVFLYEDSLVIKELGDGVLLSHNNTYSPMKIYDDCGYRCRGRVIGKAEVLT